MHGSPEAADDALPAEDGHGVEQRRGDGLTYDGDAGGVDEQAGFYAGVFSDFARGVVTGVMVPFAERFEGVG